MSTSEIDRDPYKVSYIQIALIFAVGVAIVATGVWVGAKLSS